MIYQRMLRALVFPVCLLVGGSWFSDQVRAQGAAAGQTYSAKTTLIPGSNVRMVARVSVAQLAQKPPKVTLKPPVAMPIHQRPDGSLTSGLPKTVTTLPSMPQLQPNTIVAPQDGDPVGPNTAPPPFASVKGFTGIHSKDNATVVGSELEPPDQGLAVNNNIAAEINNVVLQFYDATTGVAKLPNPVDLRLLFLPGSFSELTDPQAFFDPTTKRWFFTVVETDFAATENLDIAVSASSDPLGAYFIYHIKAFSSDLAACGGFDCLPDFPKAGYDANGFYISVNLFGSGFAGSGFVAASTYALPKSKLINGASFGFPYVRFTYPSDFVVQPSVPAPGEAFVTVAGGTEFLLAARHIIDGTHNVRLWAISNTTLIVSSPHSLRAFSVDIPIENYGMTVPSTEPSTVGTFCKLQGAQASPLLDGGYESFTATVQMAHDARGKLLLGALAFGTSDPNFLLRDSVAWVALRPSVNSTGHPSVSIVKQGYVVPGTGYSISYPAFGLNNVGKGALGFSITNQSAAVTGGKPSAAFTPFNVAASPQTGAIVVKGPGISTDDGFTGCPGGPMRKVGRWGDYGAATVDAVSGFFYTANENISGAPGTFSNWGTFITQLH